MKRVLFIMLVFFQSNYGQLHHSSFSSGSINKETKSVAVLQTVGQLSPIGSYFSNNTTVVQGFHQPFLKTKNTVELINNENIIAFPNPLEKDSVKTPISVADNQSNANAILFPIWLSSGTYDIYAYNGTASLFHISIIEFNIIQ